MSVEYLKLAPLANTLLRFIKTRWLESEDRKSQEILKKAFSARLLSDRERRDLDRIWSNISDFILEEMAKRFEAKYFREIPNDHTEICLTILDDMLQSGAIDIDGIASFIDRKKGFEEKYLDPQIIRNKLSDSETAQFKFMAMRFMEILSEVYMYAPVFEVQKSQHQIRSFSKISGELEKIGGRLERIDEAISPGQSSEAFEYERSYRRFLARRLNELPVVGLPEAHEAPDVPLEFGHTLLSTHGESGFEKSKPLLLSASAGQGKTTFLKYVSLHLALGTFSAGQFRKSQQSTAIMQVIDALDKNSADTVPFFVRLRDVKTDEFSIDHLGQFTKAIGEPPAGWIKQTLHSRNSFLVIDGLDEVNAELRSSLKRFVAHVGDQFPRATVVISGRPQAIQQFNKSFDAPEARLEPLSTSQQLNLINRWFAATSSVETQNTSDDWAISRNRVCSLVQSQSEIGAICSSPLICSAFCLLATSYGAGLPNRLYEVCNAITHMLVVGRDRVNEVPLMDRSGVHVQATPQQVSYILSLAAFDMIKTGKSNIELDRIVSTVTKAEVQPLSFDLTVELLPAIVERVGLVRYFGDEDIEFIHNIFKEFLAVEVFLDFADEELIARSVSDEGVQGVLRFVGETPSPHRYARVFDILLTQVRPSVKRDKRAFDLVVLSALATASFVRPAWQDILTTSIKHFIPPKSEMEVLALSRCGAGFCNLFRYDSSWSLEDMVRSLRVLSLIGGASAREALETYFKSENDILLENLAKHINPLEIPRFAEEFLANGTLKSEVLQHVSSLDPVTSGPCPGVTSIDISNSAVFEVSSIGSFSDLEAFVARKTLIVDANPLEECVKLREVDLNFSPVSKVEKLFQLRDLQRLSLDYTNVSALPTRYDCKVLEVLNVRRTRIRDADLEPYAGVEIGVEI